MQKKSTRFYVILADLNNSKFPVLLKSNGFVGQWKYIKGSLRIRPKSYVRMQL